MFQVMNVKGDGFIAGRNGMEGSIQFWVRIFDDRR